VEGILKNEKKNSQEKNSEEKKTGKEKIPQILEIGQG
jgi:hypothetical protein